jgi:hypothetical protein
MSQLQFIIGLLVSTITIILTLIGLHMANIHRIEQAAKEWQEMRSRLDVIWSWFENNVIGRGESNRQHRKKQEGD